MHDKTISKNKSNTLKIIAIIFMVILHTFAFPNRIRNVEYISLWTLKNGKTIENVLATFGAICVPMFLFLSGYGMYIVYKSNVKYRDISKRVLNLYKNYWIIIFIFIPIGIIVGKYELNVKELLLNFLAISSSYNSEWWFLRLYICLVLAYPLIIKLINRLNRNLIIIVSFILNIVGFAMTKILMILNISIFSLDLFVLFLGGQFVFILGIIVCKYCLFDKINNELKMNKFKNLLLLVIVSILIILLINIAIIGEVTKLILVPVFIFALSNIIKESNLLIRISNHLTNIWLTHSFFCYYLFQELSFSPKYSLLIIIWILILSLGCSVIINKILDFINKISINKRLFYFKY